MLKRFYKPMLFALAGCYLIGFVSVVWWASGRQPPETQVPNERGNSMQVHIEPSPFENWITHDATGFFTSWLVIVALGQAGLFVWQLRYMRKGMKDATLAARAASRSAIATVAQARIARDTLTKVQRPWVFVFGVKFLETRPNVRGLTPFVEYTIANYGQTPAVILNVGASFYEGILPDMPLRADDDHSLFVAPIMQPGERRENLREFIPEAFTPENLGIVVDTETGATYPIPIIAEAQDLFFRVLVQYRGAFTEGHITSACWRYHPINGHFVQYGHTDYNYEH